MPKIGIGITERNRYKVFKKTYDMIIKFMPKGTRLIVVDDFSDESFPESTYRFTENVGIAAAKNKCLELLEDCEHIFLFDSDTYPKVKDWHLPYINSKEPHLMYIFPEVERGIRLNDTDVVYYDNEIIAFTHPRGCMLYFKNICLQKAGGMNPIFGGWGFEHVEISDRIHNLGLTTFKYSDVRDSELLIHAADEFSEVQTTVSGSERQKWFNRNKEIYKSVEGSTQFIDYK